MKVEDILENGLIKIVLKQAQEHQDSNIDHKKSIELAFKDFTFIEIDDLFVELADIIGDIVEYKKAKELGVI